MVTKEEIALFVFPRKRTDELFSLAGENKGKITGPNIKC